MIQNLISANVDCVEICALHVIQLSWLSAELCKFIGLSHM